MAVYKVPQDIEADDKLIGPFSFRQFVFILIMVGLLYLTYLFYTVSILMALIPLPGAIFFGVLGLWPRKDQPVEVYLAALIHFWTKPRKKVWNREGQTEHVIITAPKKVEHQYTDGLATGEVKSRLQSLASTLDSRGWAAKNVPYDQVPHVTQQVAQAPTASDRLVLPQVPAPQPNITSTEDVLDAHNNPVGQNFQQMVAASESQHRQQVVQQMHNPQPSPQPAPAQTTQSIDYANRPDMHRNSSPQHSQTQAISPNRTSPENSETQDGQK